MEAYRIETTLTEDGTVTLKSIPFKAGERVEVLVLPATERATGRGHERLRGLVSRYDDPCEPVTSPDDWEATRYDRGTVMRRDEAVAILTAHREDLKPYRVKSLALFGSVARDEARSDSDVDILVEFERPVGYFGFFDLKEYLESLLRARVDLATSGSLKEDVGAAVTKDLIHVV